MSNVQQVSNGNMPTGECTIVLTLHIVQSLCSTYSGSRAAVAQGITVASVTHGVDHRPVSDHMSKQAVQHAFVSWRTVQGAATLKVQKANKKNEKQTKRKMCPVGFERGFCSGPL
jgi:hypothetical protein